VSRRLAATRLLLCAAPAYLREHGTPTHPSELRQHRLLSYNLLATGDTWNFEGPQGPVAVKVAPRLWSNSGDTCVAVALGGGGIILQPSFLVGPHLRSGALVPLLPDHSAVELGIYAVYPSRRQLMPKVRLMVDFLAQRLAAG